MAIPCSHIGHIFRKNSPYASEASKQFGNFVRKNSIRVAAVWLDEHANYYYQRTGASAVSSLLCSALFVMSLCFSLGCVVVNY